MVILIIAIAVAGAFFLGYWDGYATGKGTTVRKRLNND